MKNRLFLLISLIVAVSISLKASEKKGYSYLDRQY